MTTDRRLQRPGVRLAAFAAILVASFGAGALVGAVVPEQRVEAPAPHTSVTSTTADRGGHGG